MKNILITFATFLILSHAKPNGVYHQQYQYQSSSSQYKNNQLQQKTEDEGFYAKQGDLEGRQKPKVDGYSSHLHYTNPELRNIDDGDLTQQTEDFSQQGLNTQQQESNYGSRYGSSGQYAHGNRRYGQHSDLTSGGNLDSLNYGTSGRQSGYSYSSSYGASGSAGSLNTGKTYDINSNLNSVAQKLQDQLSQQLADAVTNQHRQSAYSHSYSSSRSQMNDDLQTLQDELKRNLTRQLQSELKRQYGSQGNRGSYSYTISTGGQYQPQANYDNEELDDLTKQLEVNLQKQLQEKVRNEYNVNTGVNSNTRTYGVHSDLNDITQKLQADLSRQLQNAVREQHQSSSSYRQTYSSNTAQMNADLETLKDELKRNLTRQLEEQLQKNYGSQGNRGSYSYTITSNGNRNPTANYDTQELADLKRQLENNLLNQLEKDIRTEYSQSSSSFSSFNTQTTGNQNTGKYVPYNPNRYRPSTTDDSRVTGTYITKPLTNTNQNIDYDSQTNSQQTIGTRYVVNENNRSKPNRYNTHVTNTERANTPTIFTSADQTRYGSRYNQQTENVNNEQQVVTDLGGTRGTTDEIETFLVNSKPTQTFTGGSRSQTHQTDEDDTQQVVEEPDFENIRPNYRQTNIGSSHTRTSGNQETYTRVYKPLIMPKVRLSTVLQRIENDLRNEINDAYIQEQIRLYKKKYNLQQIDNVDFTVVQSEIKKNFEDKLNEKITEELQNSYGNQVQIGSFLYTKPTDNSQNAVTANYKIDDLNDLKNQLEVNLNKKLSDTLKQEEQRYNEEHHSTYTSYQTQKTRPYFSNYDTYGDTSTSNRQVSRQPTYGTTNTLGNKQYTYTYSTAGQNGDIDSQLSTIKADFQKQLQQQIQEAVSKQQHQQYSSSHSSSSQTQQYDQAYLNQLQSELRQNLTKQLENTLQQKYGKQGQLGSISYSITSSNPNFNYNQKLADFTKQLEAELNTQLQQGLSQSAFRQQSRYSSSNYKPVIYSKPSYSSSSHTSHGSTVHSGYSSTNGETDCMIDDDPTTQINSRIIGQSNLNLRKNDDDENLNQRPESDSKKLEIMNQKQKSGQTNRAQITQQLINTEQQIIQSNMNQEQSQEESDDYHLSQKTYDDIDTPTLNSQSNRGQQQRMLSTVALNGNKRNNSQFQGQQTTDLRQQTVNLGQQTVDMGQQTVDLGQQTIDLGQQTQELGQQIENIDYSDLTQVSEDDFGQLEFSGHTADLTQQTMHSNEMEQLIHKNHDSSQQIAEDFGKIELVQKPKDLTQQVEDDDFAKLHLGQQAINHKTEQSSHQSSYRSHTYSSDQHPAQIIEENNEDIEDNLETTTTKLGFWKRVGSKIENSYNTAVNKTKSLFSG